MQHLDEGTIHTWLDGELSPDESAKAESHVRDCSECRARVAEARGLIAASTRILTALDDVPSGVVPAPASTPASSVSTRKRRWYDRTDLRTAAALLFVAGASLVAVRLTYNPGEALRTSAPVKQPAPRTSQAEAAAAPAVTAPAVAARVITPAEKKVAVSPPKSFGSAKSVARRDQTAVSASSVGGIPMTVNPIAPQVPNKSVDAVLGGRVGGVADRAQSEAVSRRIEGRVTDAQRGQPLAGASVQVQGTGLSTSTDKDGRFVIENTPVGEQRLIIRRIGYAMQTVAVSSDERAPTANVVLSPNNVALSEIVVTSVATAAKLTDAPIRQLSADSTGNTRRTVYEVAPGVHVTLAESPLPVPGVVAEGMQKANEALSRVAMQAAASVAPVMNTIRWTEGSRSYTLTGPLSIADLETLKGRIMKLHR